MVQKQQVRKTTPVIETVSGAHPQAGPEQPRAMPWLIGALIFTTLAFLALAGWTTYQRYHRTAAEHVVQNAVTAWDAAAPTALADVYAPDAVVVEADGTKMVGIKAIVADARGKGPAFSLTQVGHIDTTPDGAFTTFAYRYAGHGRGSGIAVVKIASGKIIRQWNFETVTVPAPPTTSPG